MVVPQVQLAARPQKGEQLRSRVVVGKDILELLSTAMYVDPLSIVREYIQNAADAVDCAHAQGLFGPGVSGRIDVEIHADSRELIVKDNGVGVPAADVERVLASFGASTKRGQGLRGFRGVGRLGGLGYARALTFRTRSINDPEITEIRWDCRDLREQLQASGEARELEEVVRSVVTVRRIKAPKHAAPHFFEVHLEGVVRLWNDRLLNPEGLSVYLSQVCSLPFRKDFPFAAQIEDHLGSYLPPRLFHIYLNNGSEPLRRPHAGEFLVSQSKRDRFGACQLIELPGLDGQTAAVGWILHHSYLGAIRVTPQIRGLRARVGDMQVGHEDIFATSFPESRFNSWVVGEIHVLDRRIVPNGRRDGFEHNAAYTTVLNQLGPLCRDLARRCRASSMIRSRVQRFDKHEERAKELLRGIRLGLTGGRSRRSMLREVDRLLGQLRDTAEGTLFAEAVSAGVKRRLKRLLRLRHQLGEADRFIGPLLVPVAKRRMFAEIVRLVNASAPSRDIADLMIRRIRSLIGRKGRN